MRKMNNYKFRIIGINIFFIFIHLLPFNLFSNLPSTYTPFAGSNAIWKFVYFSVQPAPYPFDSYVQDSLGSDTMINSKIYHKLYRSYFDVLCDTVLVHGPSYFGGIRQDTIQRYVNFIDLNGFDTLLYRFNLSVGDTIKYTYNIIHSNVVTSIDSIIIDGSFRLRYQLLDVTLFPLPGNFSYIIEGIGSTGGLLEIMYPLNAILTCYQENNFTFYLDSAHIQSCHSPLDSCFAASIKNMQENNWSIIPYYSSISRSIYFKNLNDEMFTVELYDLLGRVILKRTIEGAQIIFLNSKAGIYCYRISLNYGRRLIGKLIID